MIEASPNITTEPQPSEHPHVASSSPSGETASSMMLPQPVPEPLPPLLLVDGEPSSRARLQCILARNGFAVTSVSSTHEALKAATDIWFSYAVIEWRLGRDHGLELIKELREVHPSMRIVVVTGFDSFASVTVALKAGAVGYFPKPVKEDDLVNALLGRASGLPPVPKTPLGLERVTWEYIQRVFEQCDRNVSETARLLGMHRRTLQRIMGKRAPCPRRMQME